jgi:hypothetical protein
MLLTAWLVALGLFVGPMGQVARADSPTVSPAAAINHVGQMVTVCGVVASAKFAQQTKGQPTFLNLDKPYPNQVFTAVIWGSNRAAFSYAPESLASRKICVTGEIELYKGKAEIIVSGPEQIQVRT